MKTKKGSTAAPSAARQPDPSSASPPTDWEVISPDEYGQHPLGGVRRTYDRDQVREEALTAQEAAKAILDRSGDRMFVVSDSKNGTLYLDRGQGQQPEPIENSDELKRATDEIGGCPSVWRSNKGATPATTLLELRRTARKVEGIVTHVVVPEPTSDYLYRPNVRLGDKTTGSLDVLVAMFQPASPTDRCLIVALVLSAYYRKPGAVPMFVIVAPSGYGKSKLAETIGLLLDQRPIPASFAMLDGKTRTTYDDSFLHAGALDTTIAVFDNESGTVRSQALCRFVTSPTLEAAPKYEQPKARDNDILKIVTSVGLRAGTEEARRMVLIRLGKPVFDNDWTDRVAQFVNAHRSEIATDAVLMLKERPRWPKVKTEGFFPGWCNDVLSKCVGTAQEYEDLLDELADRRNTIDCSHDDASDYRDTIDEAIFAVLGVHDRPGVFHLAADVIDELFHRSSRGSRNERLSEIAASPDLADCCLLTEPIRFPSNGTGSHTGVVYRYHGAQLADYRAQGGMTAIVRDYANPGKFKLGATASCRAVERVLEGEEQAKEEVSNA